jgi:hypothetical protein
MLQTPDQVREAYAEVTTEISNESGNTPTEKSLKWMKSHLSVDEAAISEFVREEDFPSDPKEAFLLGTTFGGSIKERQGDVPR